MAISSVFWLGLAIATSALVVSSAVLGNPTQEGFFLLVFTIAGFALEACVKRVINTAVVGIKEGRLPLRSREYKRRTTRGSSSTICKQTSYLAHRSLHSQKYACSEAPL